MGNNEQNSLPVCHLNRLQRMVDGIGSGPFWIDTLCVPVQQEYKEYRNQAIRQMAYIYKQARSVLVLDSWLQEICHSHDIVEKMVRLYLCGWLRRLWTMQEGLLAKNLYFQFKDGPERTDCVGGGYFDGDMGIESWYC